MKNNYIPVSDSDDSSKLLNDEKPDTRSLDDTGTPPPYSAPNKFIDLEMADGSAQHSAQESTNNTGSDSTDSKWHLAAIFLFFASFVYIVAYPILLVMFYYFKVPVRAQDFWGLFGGFLGAVLLFLFIMHMLGWYNQVGIVLSNICLVLFNMLSNMCVPAIYTALVDVFSFAVYYVAKKAIGFEKMNDIVFYIVCALNVVLFAYFTFDPDARQLRKFIANLANGMGKLGNGMENMFDRQIEKMKHLRTRKSSFNLLLSKMKKFDL